MDEEELLELLSEFFEDDEIELLFEFLDEDEFEELVEYLLELKEGEEDEPEINQEFYVDLIKAEITKSEKIHAALTLVSKGLQTGTRKWPPFMFPEEMKKRKEMKEIIKKKTKEFEDMKKKISEPGTLQKFNVQFIKFQSQVKKLKELDKELNERLASAWQKFWMDVISKVGIPLLKVLLVVGLLAMFFIIFASLTVQAPEDIESNGITGFGVNGEKFYGVRLFYEDKEKENEQIISDYAGYLISSIDAIETENPEIDITIEIPEDYNYFTGLETDHQKVIITNIATEIYKIDNGGSVPATLTEIVGGIKYFGINEDMHQIVADAISKYINDNDLYQKAGEDELPSEVENVISTTVATEVAKNVVRTEKLFVEEQLFDSADDTLKISSEKMYKAMVYLPKQNVTFNVINIKAYKINTEDFKVYIQNGDEQATQLAYQYMEQEQYFYESSQSLGIAVSASIAPQNAVSGSLAELGKREDYLDLLTLAKDEEGNEIPNVYTYKNAGMQVKFESSVAFMFGESSVEVE